MKTYLVTATWDKNGNRYPLADTVRVEATSVRAAAGKALAPQYKKRRKGWREPNGATFTIQITVLGTKEET